MAQVYYKISKIPDLTLGKYDYLSQNGVDGVLELHNSFLWTLYEKSILSNVSFHLLYCYRKDNLPGQKIQMYLIAAGDEAKLENVGLLLDSVVISDYFAFEKTEVSDEMLQNSFNRRFTYCNSICKEEVFFTGGDSKVYYDVPLWKPNESGRLYAMFRMMEQFDEDAIFRVDIKGAKKNRNLRKLLSSAGGPISNLHMLQTQHGGERDYGAESILRDYEDLLKTLDSTPHFIANIFVFSNEKESGSLILSAALTEAIETGDYHICSFRDEFTAQSFIDKSPKELRDDSDISNRFRLINDSKGLRIISSSLSESGYENMSYLANLFTLNELAPLFRLPCLYDGEVISMRKETVAPLVTGENSLFLGYDENGYEINFPLELLPKHAFVSGVPGSGKTNTMHHITHSLWKKGIPFLVFEPAKKEYRALCNLEDMKDMYLFSPSANTKFPLHINPFEFPKGLTVAEHIRTLCQVFEGAFPLDNPMPFLLDNAIEAVYRESGWHPDDVYTDKTNKKFPTVSMLYKKLEKELEATTYSGEVKGNLESALKVRIGSLLRREMGDVFDVSKSTLSPEEWLEKPAVIELEAMGKGPANFLTLMLCSLIRECLKVNPRFEGKVRHVIFIEEAHNLIGPESEEKSGDGADAKTAATALIVKMLAEVRALREGVVIADQLPTAMAQEVIKNTGLKVALRLTAMDDRQLLCNSMSANSSQIEDMGTFRVGDALISYEGLQRPFKMRIHEWCKGEENKKELTTPKDDEALSGLIMERDSYKKSIDRSCRVCCAKIEAAKDELFSKLERIDKLVDEYCENVLAYESLFQKGENIIRQAHDVTDGLTVDFEELPQWRGLVEDLDENEICRKGFEDAIAENKKSFDGALKILGEAKELWLLAMKKTKYYIEKGMHCTDEDEKNMNEGKDSLVSDEARLIYYLKYYFVREIFDAVYAVTEKACSSGIYDVSSFRDGLIVSAEKMANNSFVGSVFGDFKN